MTFIDLVALIGPHPLRSSCKMLAVSIFLNCPKSSRWAVFTWKITVPIQCMTTAQCKLHEWVHLLWPRIHIVQVGAHPTREEKSKKKKKLAVRQVTLMLQVAIETKGRELYYSFGTWMNLGRLGVGFKPVSDSPINQKLWSEKNHVWDLF